MTAFTFKRVVLVSTAVSLDLLRLGVHDTHYVLCNQQVLKRCPTGQSGEAGAKNEMTNGAFYLSTSTTGRAASGGGVTTGPSQVGSMSGPGPGARCSRFLQQTRHVA